MEYGQYPETKTKKSPIFIHPKVDLQGRVRKAKFLSGHIAVSRMDPGSSRGKDLSPLMKKYHFPISGAQGYPLRYFCSRVFMFSTR